jgi:hypothetical protein
MFLCKNIKNIIEGYTKKTTIIIKEPVKKILVNNIEYYIYERIYVMDEKSNIKHLTFRNFIHCYGKGFVENTFIFRKNDFIYVRNYKGGRYVTTHDYGKIDIKTFKNIIKNDKNVLMKKINK